jgi:hypothetical protein
MKVDQLTVRSGLKDWTPATRPKSSAPPPVEQPVQRVISAPPAAAATESATSPTRNQPSAPAGEIFAIDSSVPIPSQYGDTAVGKVMRTLERMSPGDSFECSLDKNTVRVAARNLNVKVTQRKLPGGRRRVWRVPPKK